MEIQENKNNTNYGFDLNDSNQSIEDCMNQFINYHKLIPVNRETIFLIKKVSTIWNLKQLKKLKKYSVMYKPEKDTIFVPYFEPDSLCFTLLELYNYKQFLDYKSSIDKICTNH